MSSSFVAPFLLYAVLFYVGYRIWKQRGAAQLGDALQPSGDPTRYALASAVLEGSGFRRRVIDMARHRFRAKAPELGLDLPLIVAACERFEREDRVYDWAILGAALLSVPWFFALVNPFSAYMLFGENASTIGLAGLVLLAALLIAKAVRDVRRVAPFFRETYDGARLSQELLGDGGGQPSGSFFGTGDNVICYGKRQPFVGLGERVGGWQVAVELDRKAGSGTILPRHNGNGGAGVAPIHIGELLRAVDLSVQTLNIPNMEMRFTLFASGTEVGQIPSLRPDKFAAPRRQADPETLGHYWYYTDPRARSYRWYLIRDWNGELVFSYLLRLIQRGQSLAVETAHLVLPPIDVRYRKVDALRHRGVLGWLSTALGAILKSPLTVLHSAAGAGRHTLEAMGLARPADSEDAHEIARSQAYNYGAQTTLREMIAAKSYHVYFQQADGLQYFAAINQRVLNAVIEALQDAGIDVTPLVGQAQTVINGGVTVNDSSIRTGDIVGSGNFSQLGAGAVAGSNNVVAQTASAIGRRVSQ